MRQTEPCMRGFVRSSPDPLTAVELNTAPVAEW